jgi:hypothetical protein
MTTVSDQTQRPSNPRSRTARIMKRFYFSLLLVALSAPAAAEQMLVRIL